MKVKTNVKVGNGGLITCATADCPGFGGGPLGPFGPNPPKQTPGVLY